MIAYHFVGDKLRDGRPVPAIGEKLVHEGPVKWCHSGLYASLTPWQALEYAPGPNLCLVECDCIERRDKNKFVCRERTILKKIDATDLLQSFARKCALDVIHLWGAPDVVREYLETGDQAKREAVAWAAARWAAETAETATAWAAAMAAREAAKAAAWAETATAVAAARAAREAAKAAAWVETATAVAAARAETETAAAAARAETVVAAARDAQGRLFNEMAERTLGQ